MPKGPKPPTQSPWAKRQHQQLQQKLKALEVENDKLRQGGAAGTTHEATSKEAADEPTLKDLRDKLGRLKRGQAEAEDEPIKQAYQVQIAQVEQQLEAQKAKHDAAKPSWQRSKELQQVLQKAKADRDKQQGQCKKLQQAYEDAKVALDAGNEKLATLEEHVKAAQQKADTIELEPAKMASENHSPKPHRESPEEFVARRFAALEAALPPGECISDSERQRLQQKYAAIYKEKADEDDRTLLQDGRLENSIAKTANAAAEQVQQAQGAKADNQDTEEPMPEDMELDDDTQKELDKARAEYEAMVASKIAKRPDEGDEAYALRTKRVAKQALNPGKKVRTKGKA